MTNGEHDPREGLERRVRRHLLDGDSNSGATALLEALGPGVLRWLSTMLPPDDAQDAFSDFQQAVWRGLPAFRWECSLESWSYRVARNAAFRILRDAYRRRRSPLPAEISWCAEEPEAWEPEAGDPDDQLARLCRELAPEEQALLALRVGRRLKWNEVASVLAAAGDEISPASLRKRFERLKLKLAGLALQPGGRHEFA